MSCFGDGRGTGQFNPPAEAAKGPYSGREYELHNPGPHDPSRNNAVDETCAAIPSGSDEDINRLRHRQRPMPAHASSLAPLLGLTILIVEDVFLLADHATNVVQSAGAEVLGPVSNVDDAVQLAIARTPDAAVLNINLGSQTSFNLATALLARDIPVLFLTGYERLGLPEAYRGVARLMKPYDDRELIDAIVRLLTEFRPALRAPQHR